MRQGILWREWRFEDAAGRITNLYGFRLASMADRHLLLQSLQFTPENYSARLELEPAMAATRGNTHELSAAAGASATGSRTVAHMRELCTPTGTRVAFASAGRLRMRHNGAWQDVPMHRVADQEVPWQLDVCMGSTYRFERLVSVFTSREVERPRDAAVTHLQVSANSDVDALVAAHTHAWEQRWQRADVEIVGDESAQQAVRFACYHLIGAANADNERASIGARALTGPGYKGHVFWDTEIFMLPFYTLTDPLAARALLMYRYHTLDAAREKARRLGFRGALYAWESADTGEETTPPFVLAPDGELLHILCGEQEQHISADIAYGVWQYWHWSGDDAFFLQAGAEIILETARFWASRVRRADDGHYHIEQVIGPDEYHEGVDDNAFTNGMAQWNLTIGAQAASLISTRWPEQWAQLSHRLGLDEEEWGTWPTIASNMHVGVDDSGLIEQFRGYFALEDIDLSGSTNRAGTTDMLLGRDRVRRSRAVKQADVVMLLYLLWDRYTPAQRERNFHYYEPRTAHGSSLSPAIHAAFAARLGDTALALRYFKQGAEIDLANNMGNAAAGVHAAAMGGLWQAAVFGFGGLSLAEDGLILRPHLPVEWSGLCFTVQYHDQSLRVRIEPRAVEIRSRTDGLSVRVQVGDAALVLAPQASVRWERDARNAWKEVRHERAARA
jgi:kojibiose phosphorylase